MIMRLFTSLFMSTFSSVLCLISGVAGQAGSPETVWGIEDLYGEQHSWRWPHGCLQRGSWWSSSALLRGGLILEGQSWGNQCDLGPERNRLWTSQSGPIKQDFHSQGQEFLRDEKGLCTVWRHSGYPRLSSGNWMAGWESSSLNCHSVRIGFSYFSVLQE